MHAAFNAQLGALSTALGKTTKPPPGTSRFPRRQRYPFSAPGTHGSLTRLIGCPNWSQSAMG